MAVTTPSIPVQQALNTVLMVKHCTSVDSFACDLVLFDRYTIDMQPVEATNLELNWEACESTSHIMTR